MKIIRAKRVKALDGNRLDVTFSDGTRGIADLSRDLTGPLEPLRNARR